MTDQPKDMSLVALGEAPFTYKTLQAIANTDFVPRGLRGNVPAMLAAVMYGREIGVPAMQSINQVYVVDGKPTPSAELLTAKVRQAGHRMYAADGEWDDTRCRVVGQRITNGEVVEEMSFTYTIEMAKRAGLTGKDNWKKYPEAMLFWRAAAQLARVFFSDVLIGFYTPEELDDSGWTMEPEHVNPPPTAHAYDGEGYGGDDDGDIEDAELVEETTNEQDAPEYEPGHEPFE